MSQIFPDAHNQIWSEIMNFFSKCLESLGIRLSRNEINDSWCRENYLIELKRYLWESRTEAYGFNLEIGRYCMRLKEN